MQNKFIYIMGRGHSGSTILDALLGNGENAFSLGELVSGIFKKEDVCSCGKKIKDCSFWSEVRKRYNINKKYTWEEAGKKLKKQAHIKSLFQTVIGSDLDGIRDLEKINKNVFNSLCKVSGKRKIVDLSKEVTRGLFLVKYMQNGKIIHLVRNPLRILASNATRIEEGRFQILRHKFHGKTAAFPFQFFSSIAWMVGNIIAEIIKLFYQKKVMTIRYEDLCMKPEKELRKIEKFADVNLSEVISKVKKSENMDIKHMIAGNGMREKGEFVFDPQKSSNKKLSTFYKIMGFLITWPLLIRYKYL
jgi:hypothetical protein